MISDHNDLPEGHARLVTRDDYPMPDFGEGLVPADEVHDTDDT
jgi:hypothetical protein